MSGLCDLCVRGVVCAPEYTPHCVASGVQVLRILPLLRPLLVPTMGDWHLCPTDWTSCLRGQSSLPLCPPDACLPLRLQTRGWQLLFMNIRYCHR